MKSIEYWYTLFRKVPAPKELVVIPKNDFEISSHRERALLSNFGFKECNESLQVTPKTLDALYNVRKNLKVGEKLVIESAYRTPELLTALWMRRLQEVNKQYPRWSMKKQIDFASKYTASPTHPGNPPHSRGDAVDVGLQYHGRPINLTEENTSYEMMAYNYFENLDPQIHQNRARLREVMSYGGFIPYEREYWHFGLSSVFPEGETQ